MILPKAQSGYSQSNEDEAREALRQADNRNVKKGDTVYFARNEVIISSPNGSRWALKVSDLGVVTSEARS